MRIFVPPATAVAALVWVAAAQCTAFQASPNPLRLSRPPSRTQAGAIPKLALTRGLENKKPAPPLLSLYFQQQQQNSQQQHQTHLSARNKDDSDNNDDSKESRLESQDSKPVLPLIKDTSRVLQRVSFFSWWAQVILTAVSTVILVFARNVVGRGTTAATATAAATAPPFILSGAGVIVSCVSIVWTWANGSRLSRRLVRRPTGRFQAANLLRRAVRVGVTLNLAGLLLNLVAAEQIVGALAVKVLAARPFGASPANMFSAVEGLQPLDILVVQANTNSLLSHFCSLVALLYMTDRIRKLDPPSSDEQKRKFEG